MLPRPLVFLLCVLLLVGTISAYAAPTGEQLLLRAETIARKARSLQAILVDDDMAHNIGGTLRLSKPGLIYYAVPNGKGHNTVIVSQGRHLLNVDEAANSGTILDYEGLYDFGNYVASLLYITCFLEPGQFRSFIHPAYTGTSRRHDVTYQVVKCPPSFGRGATTFYIGPSGLPEGIIIAPVKNSATSFPAQELWVRNLRLNTPLTAGHFAYMPPATVHITGQDDPALRFLAVGDTAPAFDLPTPTGERVSLTSLLKDHSAALLNFTFAECAACLLELSTLKQLHGETQGKGLAVVAINLLDSKEEATQFLARHPLPYLMGLDSTKGGGNEQVSKGYHVDMGGVNYLISGEGKVLWRYAGMNEVRLRCVLEQNHILAFTP